MLSGVFVRFCMVSMLPSGMSWIVLTCLSSSLMVDGFVEFLVLRLMVLVKLMLPSVLMCGVVGCFSVSMPVRSIFCCSVVLGVESFFCSSLHRPRLS